MFHYRPLKLAIEKYAISDTAAEWARLETALSSAAVQLEAVFNKAVQETGAQNAEIFQAQSEMLRYPELLELCRQELEQHLVNVEAAWLVASEHFAQELEGMQNEYFRARAADVRDVADRVLRLLAGAEDQAHGRAGRAIHHPGRRPDPFGYHPAGQDLILGFCTATGGATSHTAILARSLGLPAVVGAGRGYIRPPGGQPGHPGRQRGRPVRVDADPGMVTSGQTEAGLRQELHAAALGLCHEPAVTRDGRAGGGGGQHRQRARMRAQRRRARRRRGGPAAHRVPLPGTQLPARRGGAVRGLPRHRRRLWRAAGRPAHARHRRR